MRQRNKLWIGRLLPHMNESFIMTAFNKLGLQRPLSVKIMRNKFNGELLTYGFIQFQTNDEMVDAMHKLNGRPIPGSNPTAYFYLNIVLGKEEVLQGKYIALWVGNLSADVDDFTFNRTFSKKYHISRTKVLYDASGVSKGYGLVKFNYEHEYRDALINMNEYVGLGTKPLHVFSAVLKEKNYIKNTNSNNYSYKDKYLDDYYDPSEYLKWNTSILNSQNSKQSTVPVSQPTTKSMKKEENNDEIVSYKRHFDVDMANTEFLNTDLSLWDNLEYSQWFPYV